MSRLAIPDIEEARSLAQKVLLACGHARILNLGCGQGALVQALLELGCDAFGLEPDKAAAGRTAGAPRFLQGPVTKMPCRDEDFDCLVATHCLENLDEAGLLRAVGELHRVSRRHVFLQIRTDPALPKEAAGVHRGRNWWEQLFLAHGFRKSLLSGRLLEYEALETEPAELLIGLEKLSVDALRRFPLESLARHRDLHMDMLRETGRRSEAHVVRYHLASQFVRQHDRVLDAACGLGYGAAMIKAGTLADRVVGVDASKSAIAYARAGYAKLFENLEFQQLELPKLERWADNSVDLVVSFETLEYLKDPRSFLAEIHRVLTPGGRFICSVPNLWLDPSGKDPNPYHFHTFDFGKIRELVSTRFLIEKIYAQTAGGGLVLGDEPRRLRAVDESHLAAEAAAPDTVAEWWLVVGMKDPWQKRQPAYEERMFPEGGNEPPHYLSFARDYRNPWLLRSMVTIGARASSDRLLNEIAHATLAKAPRQSADYGAAVCVLLYRHITGAKFSAHDIARLLRQANAYLDVDPQDNPHILRWRISIHFALGLHHTKAGALNEAVRQLEKCARAECREFSHLLATKTVRAAHLAAVLHLSLGRPKEAMRLWRHGLSTAYRTFSDSLLLAAGNLEVPPDFALRELTQVLDFAQQCAVAINLESRAGNQRPLFSRLVGECLTDEIAVAHRSLRQSHEWNHRLVEAKDWQAAQNQTLVAQLQKAESHATEQKLWITKLTDGNGWLEKQIQALKPQHAEMVASNAKLRAWIQKLMEAKRWLEEQNANLSAALKSNQTKLADATRWFESQRAAAKAERENLLEQLTEMRELNQSLTEARAQPPANNDRPAAPRETKPKRE